MITREYAPEHYQLSEIYIPSDEKRYAGETICLLYELLYQLQNRANFAVNLPANIQKDITELTDNLRSVIDKRTKEELPVNLPEEA